MNIFVLGGSVLIILIVAVMAIVLVMNNRSAQQQRAMAIIKGQAQTETKSSNARDEQDKRRAEIAKKLKEKGGEDKKDDKKATLSNMLEQAGLSVSVRQYWIFSSIFAAVLAVAAKVFGASGLVMILVGITGLLGFPRMFIKMKIKKRQKKFLEEFADALESMVRLLKAGMPITEAIAMASREFSGPVGEEMGRIYESQKVGVPLPEAAMAAAKRMPLTEMQMLATGLAIQAQTGASLSEVLLNLARVIRARFRLKRKVQALSAEAKASAMIIGSLPFLVGGGLFFINTEYIGLLLHTLPGQIMMAGSAVWMLMGILVMKAMINFKI